MPDPADGVNPSERYINDLCRKSFLSLWSFGAVYKKIGKQVNEICDSLIIFGNNIIIVSAKSCAFGNSGDIKLDWRRWYRKAVKRSAEQISGAERWFRLNPDNVYLDKNGTQPLPIRIADIKNPKFYRILVALDSGKRCAESFGGGSSGSLMIVPRIRGDMHMTPDCEPFRLGLVGTHEFVHVFDDVTLDVVMKYLDTAADFLDYLDHKEDFIMNGHLLSAGGEEDLLGFFLGQHDKDGRHCFVGDKFSYENAEAQGVMLIDEGIWQEFLEGPKWKAQFEANKISYWWDKLIENMTEHKRSNKEYQPKNDTEVLLRQMAKESRLRRRYLCLGIMGILQEQVRAKTTRSARLMPGPKPGDQWYVILVLVKPDAATIEEYREIRRDLLHLYCLVARYRHPEMQSIIAIGINAMHEEKMSEDVLYAIFDKWTPEMEVEAKEAYEKDGILKITNQFNGKISEFPIPPEIILQQINEKNHIGRNDPCPCGNGKKFKKCHGR